MKGSASFERTLEEQADEHRVIPAILPPLPHGAGCLRTDSRARLPGSESRPTFYQQWDFGQVT